MSSNSVLQTRLAASRFGAPIYRHIAWASLSLFFIIEFLTPLGFAHGNLYLLTLVVATLGGHRQWLIATAVIAAFLCSLGLIVSPLPAGSSLQVVVSNRLASLVAIGIVLALGLCYLNQRENNTRLRRDNAQARGDCDSSRRWLNLITDSTQVGTWCYQLDSDRFTWSEQAARMHGQGSAQPPHIRYADRFYPKAYAEKLWTLFQRCLTEGVGFDITVPMTNSTDGQERSRWVRHQGRAQKNSQGEITHVAATLLDVTHQVESEQRLGDLPAHLDALPLAVWTATKEGTPDFYNKTMSDYTGFPREILREPGYWLTLVHPDDQDRFSQVWSESVQAGTAHNIQLRIRRHDGAYCWHLMQAQPLRDALGHITQWYGSAVELPPQCLPRAD